MPESPPALPLPPIRTPLVELDKTGHAGHVASHFAHWFELLHRRVGGAEGKPIIGDVAVFQTTVGQAALASAGTATLLDAITGEQWKIREIFLSGAGTNFSGGDRLLSVTDGTTTWTVIPAATLQTLAVARWGDAGVPFPATAGHLTASSAVGTDITARYSGGATDYTAGSLTLIITAERVA